MKADWIIFGSFSCLEHLGQPGEYYNTYQYGSGGSRYGEHMD